MRLPKGFCCIVLGAFSFITIVILAFSYGRAKEWCNQGLNAGDCVRNDKDKICYCINTTDTASEQIDLYGTAQSMCQSYNGSLATPHDKKILKWLSKRMYFMGVDNPFIGLRKLESLWYWMKSDGEIGATELLWRPDFPENREHSYAMVSVETAKIQNKEYQYGQYEYIPLNYDHYLENDPTYEWFGLTTSDNKPNHLFGTYFICGFMNQPTVISRKREEPTVVETTVVKELTLEEQCTCSIQEVVELSEPDESFTFTSPRYPKNYCSDHNCRWIVSTPAELAIRVDLLVFKIEPSLDFLYIYDGETDQTLLQACTGNKCGTLQSTGSAMQIHFSTDHVITDLGFKARITAIKNDPCYCSELALVKLTDAGDSYAIMSPGYLSAVKCAHNVRCQWEISVLDNYGIKLGFMAIDMNTNDTLAVSEVDDKGDHLSRKHCQEGDACPEFVSTTKHLLISYETYSHNSSRITGFHAIATAVKNYCTFDGSGVKEMTVRATKKHTQQGYIPQGTDVLITCSENQKMANTLEDIHDVITCIGPHWSKEAGVCIPACKLEYSVEYSLDSINICDFRGGTPSTFVNEGQTVNIRTYDQTSGHILIDQQDYTCGKNGWLKKRPPTCHPMVIARIGGEFYYELNADYYSPLQQPLMV